LLFCSEYYFNFLSNQSDRLFIFALLYGLVSIEHAIANGVVQDVLRVLGIKRKRGTKKI